MSRVVVIGASGHIGTYLVPRLVEAGHHVVAVSRGNAKPYLPHAAWSRVMHKILDRAVMEDPLARQSMIEDANASWPKAQDRKAGSKAGKPGTRVYRGKVR